MTTLLLVRHGDTDALGKLLAGRQPGWNLNNSGRNQVERLAKSLSHLNIRAVYTSPLERAVETAKAIALPSGHTPVVREGLAELRFGFWEGRTFESLSQDPHWKSFNVTRSMVFPPGGERMIEAQTRVLKECDEIRVRHADETVALVSHADPIRALVAYYLGCPLDFIQRFEVAPASVTAIRFAGDLPTILCLNHTGGLPL